MVLPVSCARFAGDLPATSAQIAIARVIEQGNDIVPLVGARRRERLTETLGALDVKLTSAHLAALAEAFPPRGCFRQPLSGRAARAHGQREARHGVILPRPACGESDCLVGQAFFSCHGVLSRKMALRMVRSLRATAMIATSLGFPAARSLSRNRLSSGLKRAATIAPMNRTRRTLDRPPPMKLLPRHWPDCRVHGARPARAAICRRSSDPSSGSSAISVRAIVGPIPGTEASRSSFSARLASRGHDRRCRRPVRTIPSPAPCAAWRCPSSGAAR